MRSAGRFKSVAGGQKRERKKGRGGRRRRGHCQAPIKVIFFNGPEKSGWKRKKENREGAESLKKESSNGRVEKLELSCMAAARERPGGQGQKAHNGYPVTLRIEESKFENENFGALDEKEKKLRREKDC